jgi:signal transduction histidine kinase
VSDTTPSPPRSAASCAATPRRFATTVAVTVLLLGWGAVAVFAWQAHRGGLRERADHLQHLADWSSAHAQRRLDDGMALLHVAAAGTGVPEALPVRRALVRHQLRRDPCLVYAVQFRRPATDAGSAASAEPAAIFHREPALAPRIADAADSLFRLLDPTDDLDGHTAHYFDDIGRFGGSGPGLALIEHFRLRHEPTGNGVRVARGDGAPHSVAPPHAVVLVFELTGLLDSWQVISATRVACAEGASWTAGGQPSWHLETDSESVELNDTFRIADLELGARQLRRLPPTGNSALVRQILGLGIPSTLLLAGALAWLLDQSRRRATDCQLDSEAQELARHHLEARAVAFETAVQRRETELHTAREALLRKARELITANRQLGRRTREIESFYHTVSHELRTPLTAIREFLSIVDDELVGPINDAQRDCLRSADESCVQMQRCIDDLFDAARSETGKLELLPQPTDLRELLTQTVSACAQAAALQRVTVRCESPELPPATIDPGRIRQVLTNLIDNAVKFSPADGVVQVHARARDGGEVLFQVIDEGPGIPDDELARVFDRLHQVRSDELQTRGGLGLGLSLCRCLVERHGGRIGLDSVVGRGTTAWFTLPSTATRPTPPPTIPRPPTPCAEDPAEILS